MGAQGGWFVVLNVRLSLLQMHVAAYNRIMYNAHITAAPLEIAEIMSIKVTRNEASRFT